MYYVLSPVQELPMLANQVFLTYPLFPWCFLKGSKHAQRKMNVKKRVKLRTCLQGASYKIKLQVLTQKITSRDKTQLK